MISSFAFADDTVAKTEVVKTETAKAVTVVKADSTIKDSCTNCSKIHQACFNCETRKRSTTLENIIIFSPIIIYLIFLYLLRLYLFRAGFRLADAFTENVPVELTQLNKDPLTAVAMPLVTTKELPKSTSRLVAFISGFIAITIAVCFCTYYMYIFFSTGCAPNLENLTNILLSLGIGVIPYTINKIAGALSIK